MICKRHTFAYISSCKFMAEHISKASPGGKMLIVVNKKRAKSALFRFILDSEFKLVPKCREVFGQRPEAFYRWDTEVIEASLFDVRTMDLTGVRCVVFHLEKEGNEIDLMQFNLLKQKFKDLEIIGLYVMSKPQTDLRVWERAYNISADMEGNDGVYLCDLWEYGKLVATRYLRLG